MTDKEKINKIISKLKIGIRLTSEEHTFMLKNDDTYKGDK